MKLWPNPDKHGQEPSGARRGHEHHMSIGKSEVFRSSERRIEDRLTELEVENSRLQRLVAELLLQNQLLRDAHLPSHNFDQ
jgi:hypothetical protein